MELQLLLILAVALIVFGPEKMLEFAVQLGKMVRRIRSEWTQIQMELQMAELKEQLKKQTSEGESKVKEYLSKDETKPKSQKEFLEQMINPKGEGKEKPTQKEEKKEITIEDLFSGNAPIVEDETKNQPSEESSNKNK
jgi:Sec-independent protein translocase protein TatA